MRRPRPAAVALLVGLASGCGRGDAPPPADGGTSSATLGGPGLPPSVDAGSLEVARVAVAEPVLGERAAVYLVVRNRGQVADTLEGLSSPAAGRAGLHATEVRDGVSRMVAVGGVEVPAGGEATLSPGGRHGMLEELGRPLAAGDSVPLTLRFRRAGSVEVQGLVVSYGALDALYPPAGGGHPNHGGPT